MTAPFTEADRERILSLNCLRDYDVIARLLTSHDRHLSERHTLEVERTKKLGDLERVTAERDALRVDAERWQWAVTHAAWHREDEGTYIAVPVADGADLSCRALRDAAIDAAIRVAGEG